MKPSSHPAIDQNIKKIRKKRNFTLDMLSEKSGVSKAMLSQIESNKVNPTVTTVWKIAQGLDIEMSLLLEGSGEEQHRFSVFPGTYTQVLDTRSEGIHLKVLTPVSYAEDIEVYLLTIDPKAVLNSAPHETGTEEMLTVQKGNVRVSAGKKTADLTRGDFIIYNCDVEHSIENNSDETAEIHMIVKFPHHFS
jgi:transcriptional regulator with XRE-family HTH domain